jgi:hypothetical protein
MGRGVLFFRLRLAAGILTVLFGVLVAGPALSSPAGATAPGTAPVAVAPLPVRDGAAVKVGPYNPAQTIRLAVGLQPPHQAAEQQFLEAIQDKSSPLFHQFLSPAAWTARFGPSAAAQQAVVSWATGAGLAVTHLYPNRLVVDLSGSVGTIEKALSVKINSYRLGSQTFFANDGSPVLPDDLSGIVASVDGLSSLQVMSPASPTAAEPASPVYVPGPVVAAGPSASADGSKNALAAAERHTAGPDITNGAYDPTDIYNSEAYDLNALDALGHCCNPLNHAGSSPPETTIAIATVGSQALSDMQGFHGQYSYLAYHFQEVYVDGTPACCDEEGTMDLEWATAMANDFGGFQNTADVYMYDGATGSESTFTDIYNQMVSDNVARIFSSSWSCTETYGCPPSTMSTQDAIFSEMVGQGWTLVASSGDRGAYDNCSRMSVSFPASDPNVVAAGGTELSLTTGPVYGGEVAWSGGPDGCASNDGGSGGGCSAVFTTPSYQSNHLCGPVSRAVPDLSLNADWFNTPQNVYFDGSLEASGGTSIVAPELAGFFAQEDSYLLSEGSICGAGSSACAPLGNADFPIYESGISGAPHTPFYDITSGCNSNDVGQGFCAATGDDLVTGWGSVNMLQLAWAMNWHLLADDGRPVVAFSGPTPGLWYNTDQTVGITVTDSGGGFPASGVAGFSDAWNADPGDPTSEPTPGTGNPFYSGPEFPNMTTGTLDLAAEGQGCNTVDVESWDNMGLQSGDIADGPLCYDSVAPKITAAPQVVLEANVGPVGGQVPVTVNWAGTDATSGINHYSLYSSVNGGSFQLLTTTGTPTATALLTPGSSYRFRVTATDNAGNTSNPKTSAATTASLIQETSSAITYSSGWTHQALAGASGGSVEVAKTSGDTATLTFTGSQVAWVSTEGGAYGSATVTLDSGTPVTVNNNTPSKHVAEVVDVASAASGPHQLVVTVAGTPAHPRIDVDAFMVLSP